MANRNNLGIKCQLIRMINWDSRNVNCIFISITKVGFHFKIKLHTLRRKYITLQKIAPKTCGLIDGCITVAIDT